MYPSPLVSRPLSLLHHDELADVCLHEEESVEEDGGEEGGEHGPHRQHGVVTGGGDKPPSGSVVSHLNRTANRYRKIIKL